MLYPPVLIISTVPELSIVETLRITFGAEIVSVSPEFIVKEETVHVLGISSHVPPSVIQDGPSDSVPPVACAFGTVNADIAKIKTARTET